MNLVWLQETVKGPEEPSSFKAEHAALSIPDARTRSRHSWSENTYKPIW